MLLHDAAFQVGDTLQISRLTIGMLRGKDLKPCLRAEAAMGRRLVPIALRMLHYGLPGVVPSESRSLADEEKKESGWLFQTHEACCPVGVSATQP